MDLQLQRSAWIQGAEERTELNERLNQLILKEVGIEKKSDLACRSYCSVDRFTSTYYNATVSHDSSQAKSWLCNILKIFWHVR